MTASREILSKSPEQIHIKTARTWAARAIAYRKEAKKAEGNGSEKACELWRGFDDARHEALEHAALAGDGGKMVGRIERLMDCKGRRR